MHAAEFLHPDVASVIADLCADRADAGTIFLARYHLDHGLDLDLLRCVAGAEPDSVNDLWPAVAPLIMEAINAALAAAVLGALALGAGMGDQP